MILKNDCAVKLCVWILVLSTVHVTYSQFREIEYECGAHGRFEYCIDGIPGCVVGCHCHPGYYFDTDSKICEPNIKLTQNFRRQIDFFEPTRVYVPPVTLPVVEEPATTIKNAVDEKLDIITKDADGLGDWLYNQFFKTIENQVINETKDEGILTRRSGGNDFSVFSKPSRRSHKYWKAKKKKKRKKKKGLRSKLLRITEDDSLFDSSSGSTSEESGASSSGSSSGEATVEEKKGKKKERKQHDKDEHGHKKIIVFNKRPKPPLPSFIFLPNMDTPFFSPIGLPPPPMPMYPMVPIPPMVGPFPYGEAPPHTHNETSTAKISSTSASVTTSSATTTSTAAPATENNAPEENLETPPQNEENKEEGTEDSPPGMRVGLGTHGRPRHKLIHKLREKLKRKNKLQNYFAHEYQEPTPPFMNVNSPPNCIANPEPDRHMQLPANLAEELRGLQDVDFKYLSQLIHRADLNKTHPSIPTEPLTDVATMRPPSRRSNNVDYPDITQLFYNLAHQPMNWDQTQQQAQQTYNAPNVPNNIPPPYRKKIEATNDTYYSNLGRQIASMIRNLDGDNEFDIEITKSATTSRRPVFNGNSQGSRSYWERSIRSPLHYLKNTLRKEKRYFKHSNENLYNLENKVEIAASTKPTLGLHELENIVSKMERVKSKLVKKHLGLHRGESSKTSFNVNLLPGNIRAFHSYGKVNKESHNDNAKYLPFKTYTKRQNEKTSSQFAPEKNPYAKNQNGQSLSQLGATNNVYTRTQNGQSPSRPRPENNAYAKSQNGQAPAQLSPENNVYIRRRIEQSPPQLGPENNELTRRQSGPLPSELESESYFSTVYRNSLPDTVNSRNSTVPERNRFVSVLLPTIKPNTVEGQEYNIPNTVEAPQYNFLSNVIEQQYKRPDTVIAQQYKIPNNFQSHAYTVLPLPRRPALPPKLELPFLTINEDKTHNYELNPMVLRHKNFNYYSGSDNNQFIFQKASMPLKLPSLPWYGKQLNPSYFHHELHRFDYFDDLL